MMLDKNEEVNKNKSENKNDAVNQNNSEQGLLNQNEEVNSTLENVYIVPGLPLVSQYFYLLPRFIHSTKLNQNARVVVARIEELLPELNKKASTPPEVGVIGWSQMN